MNDYFRVLQGDTIVEYRRVEIACYNISYEFLDDYKIQERSVHSMIFDRWANTESGLWVLDKANSVSIQKRDVPHQRYIQLIIHAMITDQDLTFYRLKWK